MNGYIIVLPTATQTSEQRAHQITRELYNISRPILTQSDREANMTVFGQIEHPDGIQNALQINTDFVIQVSDAANLERLTACFPELQPEERFNLAAYIQTNKEFLFGHIVPSDSTIRTQEYMEQNGWFPDEPNAE